MGVRPGAPWDLLKGTAVMRLGFRLKSPVLKFHAGSSDDLWVTLFNRCVGLDHHAMVDAGIGSQIHRRAEQ